MIPRFWNISSRIQFVEGFPVEIVSDVSSIDSASSVDYDFSRAMSYKTTVGHWKQTRFNTVYPNLKCFIPLSDGTPLSDGEPIGIARNQYRKSPIHSDGRTVAFTYSSDSELAVLEVKRVFASIGYDVAFSPDQFLWMKSWRLTGVIDKILLHYNKCCMLMRKLDDIGKSFKCDCDIGFTSPNASGIRSLPRIAYFSDPELEVLLNARC